MAETGSKTTVVFVPNNSNQQQAPNDPEQNQNKKANSNDRVLLLRRELAILLQRIRQIILQQDSGRQISNGDLQFQRTAFYQIYTIVLELISNGHRVNMGFNNSLVISSMNGNWSETIEYQVADYLDVHDQLINQQFPINQSRNCPTILSARFVGERLTLSIHESHSTATNVIYGIRCRHIGCRRNGPGNISYVGQSSRSVHQRVCNEHARSVVDVIENQGDRNDSLRPMYDHVARHLRDLPSHTEPRNVFSQSMDVIILPTGSSGDLRSMECFWQFFLHARRFFMGWSQR